MQNAIEIERPTDLSRRGYAWGLTRSAGEERAIVSTDRIAGVRFTAPGRNHPGGQSYSRQDLQHAELLDNPPGRVCSRDNEVKSPGCGRNPTYQAIGSKSNA